MLAHDLPLEERYRHYVQVFSPTQRDRLFSAIELDGPDCLTQAFARATSGDPLRRLLEVDLATQLLDDLLMLTDKMTMAASLECRVPLLDHELVELSARMPSRFKIHGRELKYILKKALSGLLPPDILHRRKRGFGAPMGAWLKRELSPLLKSVLSRDAVLRRGLFDWKTVEQTIALHEMNREDHTDHLLSLLNLEIWCRMFLDGQSPHDLSHQIESESLH
jgi:asparagine synthase (glutamine-hydrolysing)